MEVQQLPIDWTVANIVTLLWTGPSAEAKMLPARILGARRGPFMLKWLMLCVSILLLSITAAARDTTAAPDESSLPSAPAAADPVPLAPTDRSAWDLSIGYQYQ